MKADMNTVMTPTQTVPRPAGKKGLIVGIANEHSIAYGCAQAIRAEGGSLAVTYLNQKALPYVQPLADGLGAEIVCPLDVEQPDPRTVRRPRPINESRC